MGHYFDKYVFIAPGSDYGHAMWSDLEDNPDCLFLDFPIKTKSTLLRICHHIHFSFGINKLISLPFKEIWRKFSSLEKVEFDEKLKYCIILPDVSACRMEVKYLEKVGSRKNVEIVLVNVNVVEKKKKLIDERIHCFSKIFSFDKNDCEKYGYIYHPTIYSKPQLIGRQGIESDAFFVGSYTSERYEKLIQLHNTITGKSGKTDFHIIGVPRSEKRISGIEYNRHMSYSEVIQRSLTSNCIVEIMNPGQSGLTLRAMEAICLNKKLITDNESVSQLDYYSRGFIRIFNQVSESDIDFVMRTEPVDYQYRNDFSPNQLITHIENEYKRTNK